MSKQAERIENIPGGVPPSADPFFEEFLRVKTFKDIVIKYRIGIYVAVIITMLLIIFFLGYKISAVTAKPYSFSLVNTLEDDNHLDPEAIEEAYRAKLESLQAEVEARLQDAGVSSPSVRSNTYSSIRNVAVNTQDRSTAVLRDSKGINHSVYEEARQVQAKMDVNRKAMQELQSSEYSVPIQSEDAQNTAPSTTQEAYQGPSVLSYTLDGRRAMHLPIPAYKCEQGGDVTVIIEVNANGYVVDAEVDKAKSSPDPTLHHTAILAAKSSRFTTAPTANKKQQGTIIYRFIAQ